MGRTCQGLVYELNVFSYSPVGHPPIGAIPARGQLLAPVDSWQSTGCCLLAIFVSPVSHGAG